MAIGTVTRDNLMGQKASAPTMMDLVHFTGDSAYPTGGTASFKSKIRDLANDNRQPLAVIGQDCGGYVPVYDHANDKLKVYYANNDGGADGPLIEVPNATDLSGVTFNVLVISV